MIQKMNSNASFSLRPSLSPSFSLPGITTPNLGVRPETLLIIGVGVLALAYISNRNKGLSDLGQSTTGAVTNVADAVGNTAGLVANVSDKANSGINALYDIGYGLGRSYADFVGNVSKTVSGGTKSGSAVIKTTSGGVPASLSTSVSAPVASSGLLVNQVRQSVASATASKPSVIDAAKNVLSKASPALSAVNSLSKIRIK